MAGNVNLRSNGYVTEIKPGIFVIDPNKPATGPDPRFPIRQQFRIGFRICSHHSKIIVMNDGNDVPLKTLRKLFQTILEQVPCDQYKVNWGVKEHSYWKTTFMLYLPLPKTCNILNASEGPASVFDGPTRALEGILKEMNLPYVFPSHL